MERKHTSTAAAITVGQLVEDDLPGADRVVRLAFGTFLGVPDPLTFMGDADRMATRWRANPAAAFGARDDGRLIGANFATRWGSVGFFGPLAVHPDYWDRGVGARLIEPVVGCFEEWGTGLAGLCTFPHSAKHIGLYQKFGFWPRFLTAIMSKPVMAAGEAREPGGEAETGNRPGWTRFSAAADAADGPADVYAACRELTEAVYEGLDVEVEIRAIHEQGLGETVLLWDGEHADRLAGLATCHVGAGSEAGSGSCFIKFGAVRPGPRAGETFARLLRSCEDLAADYGVTRLEAGVNTARYEAYRTMLASGFRSDMQMIVMQRHNETGYNRPGVYLIDDWR